MWLASLVGETDNPVGEPRSVAEAGIRVAQNCIPELCCVGNRHHDFIAEFSGKTYTED